MTERVSPRLAAAFGKQRLSATQKSLDYCPGIFVVDGIGPRTYDLLRQADALPAELTVHILFCCCQLDYNSTLLPKCKLF